MTTAKLGVEVQSFRSEYAGCGSHALELELEMDGLQLQTLFNDLKAKQLGDTTLHNIKLALVRLRRVAQEKSEDNRYVGDSVERSNGEKWLEGLNYALSMIEKEIPNA